MNERMAKLKCLSSKLYYYLSMLNINGIVVRMHW